MRRVLTQGIIYDILITLVSIEKTFGNYILAPEIVIPEIIKRCHAQLRKSVKI
jgi:hypothetical protein